jgi:poly-gamma-glutamate synthesis protein (capsule biosynthesis protein)
MSARGVSLLFVGDIMPLTPFSDGPSKVELGAGVAELFRTDVLLANLEGPIGDDEPDIPTAMGLFADAPRLVMTPAEWEMHRGYLSGDTVVVSTANNHAWDLGAEGITRTLDELGRLQSVGVGTSHTPSAAEGYRTISAAGITIGLVPFTFGTNGLGGTSDNVDMVNVASLNEWRNARGADRVVDAVRACREAGCDVVVASLHWGLEFEWFPVEQQIRTARRLVEAGADVVWGHHPHVIQPAELYAAGSSGRTGLIMYSTGNLVTPVLTVHSRLSLAVKVTAGTDGSSTALQRVELVPMVFSAANGTGAYRLDRLDMLAAEPSPVLDGQDVARIVAHLRVTMPDGLPKSP